MVQKFIKLGPAFVKFGQLLSVRSDVLPQPYMEEFYKLQDQVPQAPFEEIEKELNEEYGDYKKVFDKVEPVAINAASLGQVHEAVYKGNQVVIKVLRPNVEKVLEEDVKAIKSLLPFLSLIFGRSFVSIFETVVDQFYETAKDEMDYVKEAKNMEILKKFLSKYEFVVVPNVIKEVSTKKVLVMQRVDGIKITDVKKLDEAGIDRKALARRLSRIYLSMVLRGEVFHADPHPGNLAVSSEGKIILYDYGMIGSMSKEMRDNMMWLYMSMAQRNPSEIREALIELGVLDPFANPFVIEKAIELALSEMQGVEISEADVKTLMYVANKVIYKFPFKLPKELVLYLRMGLLLDSVCRTLDPSFNFISELPKLFREEGIYRDYYIFRLKRLYKRISKAIDSSIRLAPIMEEYYQLQMSKQSRSERSPGFYFVAGVLTGVFILLLVAFLARVI